MSGVSLSAAGISVDSGHDCGTQHRRQAGIDQPTIVWRTCETRDKAACNCSGDTHNDV